jgi:hypothetical protein
VASGGANGRVRLGAVSQQALSGQHPGLHAISPRAFVAIQVAAGKPAVAATRTSPTIKDAVILLNIALISNRIRGRSRDAQEILSVVNQASASLV